MDINLNPKKIDPRISFFEFVDKNKKKTIFMGQSFSFDFFLFLEKIKISAYTTNTNYVNTYYLFLKEYDFKKTITCLTQNTCPPHTNFFFYELLCWPVNNNQPLNQLNCFYNAQLVNYATNVRFSFFTKVKTNASSISDACISSVWPEREIQDMFNIKISSLTDTRRLLLDYKIKKGVLLKNQSYKNVPQHSNFFDVYYI